MFALIYSLDNNAQRAGNMPVLNVYSLGFRLRYLTDSHCRTNPTQAKKPKSPHTNTLLKITHAVTLIFKIR